MKLEDDVFAQLGLKVSEQLAPSIDKFEEIIGESPEQLDSLVKSLEKLDEALVPLNPNRVHMAFAVGTQLSGDRELGICLIALCAGRKMEREKGGEE